MALKGSGAPRSARYLNAVGAKRAYNVAEAFCRLVQQETGAPCGFVDALLHRKRRLRVASVGGGPGSCLLGYCVFERVVAAETENRVAEAARSLSSAGSITDDSFAPLPASCSRRS